MEKFLPFLTGDNSVGLISDDADDIYHSVYGAITEAYDKFVRPIDLLKLLKTKNELHVLDICYGIGYNSKVLINLFLTNKIYNNLNIDCVEIDSELLKLSPFIKSKVSIIDKLFNKNLLIKNLVGYNNGKYKNLEHLNSNESKLDKYVNIVILNSLLNKFSKSEIMDSVENYLLKHENHVFLDNFTYNYIKILAKMEVYLYQNQNLSTYLHNIYYENILNRYNIINKYDNLKLNFYDIDARKHIKDNIKEYDVIFLDGFTPAKCPALWTLDFLKQLYSHITNDGLLVTYNTSVAARSAMIQAGFYIGNVTKDKNIIGTICSKNETLIQDKLDSTNEGLLKTKAGIPYRDINLDLSDDIIIYNREEEVSKSNLESSSKYLKRTGV